MKKKEISAAAWIDASVRKLVASSHSPRRSELVLLIGNDMTPNGSE